MPCGPPEHRRALLEDDSSEGRVQARVEKGVDGHLELRQRRRDIGRDTQDALEHLRLGRLEDGTEELLLVAEVVIERTAGDLGRPHDLLGGGGSITLAGEQPLGGAHQCGARRLALLNSSIATRVCCALRWPRPSYRSRSHSCRTA